MLPTDEILAKVYAYILSSEWGNLIVDSGAENEETINAGWESSQSNTSEPLFGDGETVIGQSSLGGES